MQKQTYETPDLVDFGTVESITGGERYFSPQGQGRDHTSGVTTYKPDWHEDDDKKGFWSWGWHR